MRANEIINEHKIYLDPRKLRGSYSDPQLEQRFSVYKDDKGRYYLDTNKASANQIQLLKQVWNFYDPRRIYEASGYIPSASEADDPRYSTALTIDVKPNAIKKNAKAFNFKVSRAGIPPTLKPNGTF